MFKFAGRIIDSTKKIMNNIVSAAKEFIMKNVKAKKPMMDAEIKMIIRQALSSCPEIESLRSGRLKVAFGLPDDPTDTIINAICDSVYSNIITGAGNSTTLDLSVMVYISPTNLSYLLNMPEASIITEKGRQIPWLSWLLTRGNDVLITGYMVRYEIGKGRSGGGFMMKTVKKPRVFKVDSEFAGTEEDNFITRALDPKREEILNALRKVLE